MTLPSWPNFYRITMTLDGVKDNDRSQRFYLFAMDYEDVFKRLPMLIPAQLANKNLSQPKANTILIECLGESYGFTDSAHAKIKLISQ